MNRTSIIIAAAVMLFVSRAKVRYNTTGYYFVTDGPRCREGGRRGFFLPLALRSFT